MIIDLPSTTTSQVNNKLVEVRERGGAVALGRVLTLVIVTDDGARTEEAVDAANDASRLHPCRVIVVAKGARKAAPRLDAQIRVGGDAGASEVVVLRLYGPLADEGASCVIPLLLPDAPVVAWWPFEAPAVPAKDPIGELAHRRITDSAAEKNPIKALEHRQKSYADGDTDLAWTRLTTWRTQLAAALDLAPFDKVTDAEVTGEADSPSTDLLAAWLGWCLRIPVKRSKTTSGQGIVSVVLERKSGNVELHRPDGKIGILTQPGQPERRVALHRREVQDCLSEELRRLDADEIYEATLKSLSKVVRTKTVAARKPAAAKAATATAKPVAATAKATAKPAAKPAAAKAAKPSTGAAASPNGSAAKAKPEPKPARRVKAGT
ncbi:glucose-6-phosphate dehydrogenase assembly protein OpcA [Solihabitans fulvus]|uniref:Glucose-6-phosphate dehydrogenase assembly protein OpcA n=1 Tax=Solihabitans fulvus TaxID=1892852 RepID=A0A5B2XG75_9PSEU|nr:glucose-6-phosphate dehydrogenase assembly protein OpcA [Solihabitans fulvus]KAA2261782.1 glucose-6-phosphate dehydrogenase assembly protein OpcA [Solihabitans fulvus]